MHVFKPAKYLAWQICLVLAAGGLLLPVPRGLAAVAGKCVDCHTMHYSQNGQVLQEWGGDGPYDALLTTDCIGCHTGVNAGGTTPFVMSTAAPVYAATGTEANTNTLAGGSFYWVASGDHLKGHNVTGLTSADPFLPVPPGFDGSVAAADGSIPGNGSWPAGQQVTCAGIYGCHGTHAEVGQAAAIYGGHHKGKGGALTDPGTRPANGFRLLVGIAGYEDPGWELAGSGSHNQYKGVDGGGDNSTLSSLCLRCHADFHSAGQGNWFAHPVEYDLGNTDPADEVRGYGGAGHSYRVDAPDRKSVV